MADQNNKKHSGTTCLYMPIGMCLGMSLGLAIGAAIGSVSIGMCMGLGVGMCIGSTIDTAKNHKDEDAENPDDTLPEEEDK